MRLPAPLAALFAPRRFFAESEHGTSLLSAAVVVSAVALLVTATYAGIGLLLVSSIDATVTVDNPDRPPEGFCEPPIMEMHEDDCAEPAEIERDAGDLLWEVWTDYVPLIFVGMYAVWLLVGTLLYALGRLFASTGRWTETVAVWGWAMLADLLQAVAALAFFAWLTAGETITADTEAELIAEVEALLAAVPEFNPLPLVVGAWQIWIVIYGLSETQDASVVDAALAAVIVLVPVSFLAAV